MSNPNLRVPTCICCIWVPVKAELWRARGVSWQHSCHLTQRAGRLWLESWRGCRVLMINGGRVGGGDVGRHVCTDYVVRIQSTMVLSFVKNQFTFPFFGFSGNYLYGLLVNCKSGLTNHLCVYALFCWWKLYPVKFSEGCSTLKIYYQTE